MDENWRQLATYVSRKQGSDEAFAAIVERHVGLVYSAALRQVNDRSLAEEVTQSVFVLLAGKAAKLKPTGSLAAWLYNAASLKAKESLRSELARRKRERKAHDMATTNQLDDDDTLDWERVAPLLDTAMGELPDADREAVLLRYFQNRPLRDVGASLGVSEEAARKRVSRAVDRLRGWFAQRGLAFSAAALAAALPARTIEAVPAHLATSTLQAVAAETAAAAASASTTTILTTMASTKSIAIAAALIGAAIPISLGYLDAPSADPPARETPVVAADPLAIPEPKDSELVAEWKRLRSQFGPDAGSMPELYGAIKDYKDTFRRRAFRGALLAEWAMMDGAGALAYLKKHDKGMLGQLFGDWLKTDPEAAIAALKAGGRSLERQIKDHLKTIAKISPGDLPELAVHVSQQHPWDLHIQDAVAEFAKADFEAARTMAAGMDGDSGLEATAGIVLVWAERDGPAAFEWVQKIANEKRRDRAMQALLVGWAKSDPRAALERIHLAPPGGTEHSYATTASQVVKVAAEQDFDLVLEWFAENAGSLDERVRTSEGLRTQLSRRFMADVPGTLDFIRGHPAEKSLTEVLDSMLLNQAFARRDAVWEWANAQDEESEFAAKVRGRLLRSAAWKAPDIALGWLEEMRERGDEVDLEEIAGSLINHGGDIQRLDHLLERVPVGSELRKQILRAGFGRLREAFDAPAWVVRLDELEDRDRPMAIRNVARGWAEQDPGAAIAWTQGMGSDEERRSATEGLVEGWANGDSYGASQWIAGLEEGGTRDAAIMGLVTQIVKDDPDAAWEWTNSIGSMDYRVRAATAAIRAVARTDREAAQRMLDSMDMPAQKREGLQHELDHRRFR